MTEEVDLARVLHLLAICQDAAMLVDCETRRYVEVNREAVELLGCEQGGLVAAGAFQDHDDNTQRRRDILATCDSLIERFPQAITSAAVFHHRNGSEIRVTVTRQALPIAGRWHVLVTARLASRNMEAQERLERLSAAINEAADALQVVDALTMEYVEINDAAARLFGLSRERMMALGPAGVGQAIEKEPADAVRAQYDEAIARYPEAVCGMREFQSDEGGARTVEFTRRALRSGGRWLIVIAERDVTERMADRRRLKQMHAALNDSDALGVIDAETLTYTVLVEGDDMTEPVADETRSILDGHIILSRKLGAANHFPAIDVLASASRVMNALISPAHKTAAGRVRELMAKYADIELLLKVGEYKRGTDAVADKAIDQHEAIRDFLRQGTEEHVDFDDTLMALTSLAW